MKCLNCGHENPDLKKTCERCGAILEGECINNVTGEKGYRGADGGFYPNKETYLEIMEIRRVEAEKAQKNVQNIMKNFTSEEQSRTLIDLGLDRETADFIQGPFCGWSSHKLSEILPKTISNDEMSFDLDICSCEGNMFEASYRGICGTNYKIYQSQGYSIIQALFELTCTLIKEKKIEEKYLTFVEKENKEEVQEEKENKSENDSEEEFKERRNAKKVLLN